MIFETTTNQLENLQEVVAQLPKEELCKPLPVLSNSSVGMHIRHILEFYLCLMDAQNTGMVNYDKRARKIELETQPKAIQECIQKLVAFVDSKPANTALRLQADYGSAEDPKPVALSSTMHRELLYNIEHGVHHMALIKIGLQHLNCTVNTAAGFGVASSTIRNREACAQ